MAGQGMQQVSVTHLVRAAAALLPIVAVAAFVSSATAAGLLSDSDRQHYETAFRAANQGAWPAAHRHAGRASDPTLRSVLDWLEVRRSRDPGSFAELVALAERTRDWPSHGIIRRQVERAIDRTTPHPALLAWFAEHEPLTREGVFAYADALRASGMAERIAPMVRKAWVDFDMLWPDERDFLARFGDLLTREDHIDRLERLLWEGKSNLATRQARRVDPGRRALAEARILLRNSAPGVDAAIARVPDALQNDQGLVYERLRWRRLKGRDDSAAELLPLQPASVDQPDLWWRERSILVRRMLREGAMARAYEIAAGHGTDGGFPLAEGEWLAGWIALRFLDDPLRAFPHFRRMYESVNFPVSLSRAAYWAGRAADAGGEPDIARQWYAVAAAHPTMFYGQMAALHLPEGERPPVPPEPTPTQAEQSAFDADIRVRIVRMLSEAGASDHARTFFRHLVRNAETPAEFAMLGQLATTIGRPDEAVYTAREAIKQHVILSSSGYPTVPIPTLDYPSGEIVLGLVRQESGFQLDAISSAGARGLMQLMPATARSVAQQARLPYEQARLLTDPDYNIRLGSAYLAGLIHRFGGSLVMALAGYNAGPHRAQSWARDNGDPGLSLETAIDWIELIPFAETRNYVQRVIENITVYRQRSAGRQVALSLMSDDSAPASIRQPGHEPARAVR